MAASRNAKPPNAILESGKRTVNFARRPWIGSSRGWFIWTRAEVRPAESARYDRRGHLDLQALAIRF